MRISADINNDKINAANEWIKEVAAETGTRYSDTCSVLKDAEGWLRDDPAERRLHPPQRTGLHRGSELPAHSRFLRVVSWRPTGRDRL